MPILPRRLTISLFSVVVLAACEGTSSSPTAVRHSSPFVPVERSGWWGAFRLVEAAPDEDCLVAALTAQAPTLSGTVVLDLALYDGHKDELSFWLDIDDVGWSARKFEGTVESDGSVEAISGMAALATLLQPDLPEDCEGRYRERADVRLSGRIDRAVNIFTGEIHEHVGASATRPALDLVVRFEFQPAP